MGADGGEVRPSATPSPSSTTVASAASIPGEVRLWIVKVCTVGSAAKIERVPSPSWRSRSTTSTRPVKSWARRSAIAAATSL